MKTYKVEIKETLSKIIEVEASSFENALLKVKEDYHSEKIILDYNNFLNTEISEFT